MNTRSQSLLSGNIFCGHCGSHLAASRANYKYKVVNGTPEYESRRVYTCYHRTRKLSDCDGQSVYQAKKVEELVINIAKKYFSQILDMPEDEALKIKRINCIESDTNRISQSKVNINDLELRYKALIDEIGKALIGESVFTPDILRVAIDKIKIEIEENKKIIEYCEREIEELQNKESHIDEYYAQLIEWANIFDTVSLDEKKMILCQMFDKIIVRRGYDITVVLYNIYQQFFE